MERHSAMIGNRHGFMIEVAGTKEDALKEVEFFKELSEDSQVDEPWDRVEHVINVDDEPKRYDEIDFYDQCAQTPDFSCSVVPALIMPNDVTECIALKAGRQTFHITHSTTVTAEEIKTLSNDYWSGYEHDVIKAELADALLDDLDGEVIEVEIGQAPQPFEFGFTDQPKETKEIVFNRSEWHVEEITPHLEGCQDGEDAIVEIDLQMFSKIDESELIEGYQVFAAVPF